MNKKQNRREFLKNSLASGAGFAIGCCILSGCAAQNGKKEKIALAADAKEDYSQLAYCCLDCSKCELLIATRDNNDEMRAKVAQKWEMYKVRNFRFEDFYCYGCKSGKPGQSEMGCTVKDCAIQKGLPNCAYCDNLDACDKELWKEFPWIKKKATDLRAKLLS